MTLLVISLSSSGVAVGQSAVSSSALNLSELERATPDSCPSARKAVRFYSRRIAEHQAKMRASGTPTVTTSRALHPSSGSCPRYLARILQRKAAAWRVRVERWLAYQYDWRSWLPSNWRRLGACETGYGREPGNFHFDSGSHVSAFGITRHNFSVNAARIGKLSWDETRQRLHRDPTPREQYENALSHLATYGDGWTCPGP